MKKTILSTCIAALLLTGCGGDDDDSSSSTGGNNNQIRQATLTFQRASITVDEGHTGDSNQAVLQLRASSNVQGDVVVRLNTLDDTAIAGVDFVAMDDTYTIRNGERTLDIPVSIIGNDVYQSDRAFSVGVAVESGGQYAKINGELTGRITIADDDAKPVIGFVPEITQVHESIGTIEIVLKQSGLSAFTSTVDFDVSGLATPGVDYRIEQQQITFEPLSTQASIFIHIIEDDVIEGTEDIRITLKNPQLALLGGGRDHPSFHPETMVLILGDLRLPDTAVVHYYNEGDLLALVPDGDHPHQDADYGLDSDDRFIGNGQAGFYFIKIDDSGNAMPASSNHHRCIFDGHTGLTFEVKTPSARFVDMDEDADEIETRLRNDANAHWQASNNRYMWRNPNNQENAGNAGGSDKEELYSGNIPVSTIGMCRYPSKDAPGHVGGYSTHGCTSDKYVETMNKIGRCGFTDWRLPGITELMSIMSYQQGQDTLDKNYFNQQDSGNAVPSSVVVLSATPSVDNDASAWCYDTGSNRVQLCNKRNYHHIRLVRGPKL